MTKQPWEIIQEQMEVINKALLGGTPVRIVKKMDSGLSHEQKTLRFFAHDYRDMKMSEDDLTEMLEGFAEALQCDHQCSSNCRRNGCNCACGEYHF